jgi:hypothetical protein
VLNVSLLRPVYPSNGFEKIRWNEGKIFLAKGVPKETSQQRESVRESTHGTIQSLVFPVAPYSSSFITVSKPFILQHASYPND